ncbi:vacuolar protein sorting-associated protein 33A-like isoform X2 [Dreissena polymorpha]|uniref:vacuolar protein sorting-associated protein 33A-like isoform X2 n=1 Tax=Dreissena polymorpha TaxID=45954 RepID=UPI002264A4F5|nr:vacuolar protein sorting-associated protein 33A-like isoform X2 [Dreissena polymorpha]
MAASGGEHLRSGKINLGSLRDFYRRELLEILDKCNGTKALVWDEALTRPFGLIVEYSLLKERDVEKVMSLPKENEILNPSSVQNIIYITRPRLELMDLIASSLLKEDQRGGFRKEYHIIFVPRKSLLCERRLKEAGVHGSLTNIEEFSLNLIPFDNDLLSMEMEDSFKECYLENDMTSMFHAAQSLVTLQTLYGIIPNIYGKGECAKHVKEMMLRIRRELDGLEPQITPQIDNLFIIDRTVDLLTPLLTQLTYEGLIDEIYGISNTSVRLPPEKFINKNDPSTSDMEFKNVVLNSGDELFAELRDRNFSAVPSVVSKKAKLITSQFDERHAAKTVGEMKNFVSKLPHLQKARTELAQHTSIAELVKEATDSEEFMESLHCQQDLYKGEDTDSVNPYIEDCIGRKEPLVKILRLLCIQSFCNNGLKPKVLEFYKREIVQTYGFKHLVTLGNLEKVGMLRAHTTRNYQVVRKSLKLTVDTVNEMSPNDISYVYSGYAPLSVRLIQYLARPGWRSITEVLNILPGPNFDEVQQIPVALRKRRTSITSSQSSMADQKVTLVFFLGGVTYAEIAALRFLAQQDDGGTDYVIATTKIINGGSLLHKLTCTQEPTTLNPFL